MELPYQLSLHWINLHSPHQPNLRHRR